MRIVRISLIGLLLWVAASAVQAADTASFYGNLLQRGVADVNAGQYARAITELRIAAFGMLDNLPEYERAQIHLAVASEKLGKHGDALLAVQKVVRAEAVTPSYAALTLDASSRETFEKLLGTTVKPEQLAAAPALARAARGTSAPPPTPRKAAPSSTPAPPPDLGTLAIAAQQRYDAGDLAGARKTSEEILARDTSNPRALVVLAHIAAREKRWTDAVSHLESARTRARFSADENALLFVALVNSGRRTDATTLRNTLPASVLARDEVRAAVALLAPPPPPPTLTPQTSVAPTPPPPPPPPPTPQPSTTATVKPPPPAPPPTPTVERRPPRAPNVTNPSNRPAAEAAAAPPPTRVAPTQPTVVVGGDGAAVSPLVAAARHAPSESPLLMDAPAQIEQAQRLLNEGKILAARQLYLRLAQNPSILRSLALEVARGLNQTSAWRDSSVAYQKLYPLREGEEPHMFIEAVNRYELGDYPTARTLLSRALPAIPVTREVSLYRAKIEATR